MLQAGPGVTSSADSSPDPCSLPHGTWRAGAQDSVLGLAALSAHLPLLSDNTRRVWPLFLDHILGGKANPMMLVLLSYFRKIPNHKGFVISCGHGPW